MMDNLDAIAGILVSGLLGVIVGLIAGLFEVKSILKKENRWVPKGEVYGK